VFLEDLFKAIVETPEREDPFGGVKEAYNP